MSTDALDKLRIADERWRDAKAEVVSRAAARRDAVREARDAGATGKEIASLLGVTTATVSELAADRYAKLNAARKKLR